MTTTRSASSAAQIDRGTDLIPVVLIGEAPLARALGARLTDAGVPVDARSSPDTRAALDAAGLIIEASDAAASVRLEALHRIEHAINSDIPIAALLFTGTLASLARRLHAPERLVGLSILDTGDSIGFVEIARSDASAETAIAAVRAVFDSAGIPTMVVPDSPGHYVARVAHRYVNEGLALLGEGVSALAIEDAARQAGMSKGPLALLDAISLDEADRLLHGVADSHGHGHGHEGHVHDGNEHDAHGHADHEQEHAGHEHWDDVGHSHGDDGQEHFHEHEHEHERGHHHDRAPVVPAHRPHEMTTEAIYVLEKMAHGFKRMGKQSGRGFYEYDEDDDEAPVLWSGLKVFERRRVAVSFEDLRDRLLYAQALESLRCLQEAVVASAADANLGSVLGWGFPDDTGGTIAFVEGTGSIAFLERARQLAQRYGERFDPPVLLARHAESGEPFRGASR